MPPPYPQAQDRFQARQRRSPTPPAPAELRRSSRTNKGQLAPTPFWVVPPAPAHIEEVPEDEEPPEDASHRSGDEEEDDLYEDAQLAESALLANIELMAAQTESISFYDALEHCYKSVAMESEPRTLAEALKRPDGDRWYQAAAEEMAALIDNGTFE